MIPKRVKIIRRILIIILMILIVTPAVQNMLKPRTKADTITSKDGLWFYKVEDGMATITGWKDIKKILGNKNTFEFPESIDGVVVNKIVTEQELFTESTEIFIPKSITEINLAKGEEWYSFLGYNSSLESIVVAPENKVYKSVDGVLYSKDGSNLIEYPDGKDGEEFTVPEGVQKISFGAFYGNSKLKKLDLPSTFKEFEHRVINGKNEKEEEYEYEFDWMRLPNIETISVSPQNKLYKSDNGILYDTNNNIVRCPMKNPATEIKIKEGSTEIKSFALNECKNIRNIELPQSMKVIGYSALAGTNIENINLPWGLERICGSSFNGTGLKRIIIPDSVEEIDAAAFYNLQQFEYGVVPATITKCKFNYVMDASFLDYGIFGQLKDGSKVYCVQALGNPASKYTVIINKNNSEKWQPMELDSIRASKTPKIDYKEGETFDIDSMGLMAKYKFKYNGEEHEVEYRAIVPKVDEDDDDHKTKLEFSPSGLLTPDDKEVTISYSNNGITKTLKQAINVEKNGSDTPNPPEKEFKISSSKYKILEKSDKLMKNLITRVDPNTTVADFKKNIECNYEYKLYDSNDNELNDDDKIKTATKLKSDGREYTISVLGDINADGEITLNDAINLLEIISNKDEESNIPEEKIYSGYILNEDKSSLNDALAIMKYVATNR